jgi:electron transfer flavoprotein alpha subunit
MGGVCDILASVIRQHEPAVVLFPATDWGKAVAAKLSVRLDVGLTADCIDVTLEDDFSFYRTAMNQTMLAKIRYINCNIRMGTIKKDVFVKKTWEYGTTGKIETFPTLLSNDDLDHSFLEILECVQIPQKIGMDLEKVSIAFCVGRGVKKKETCDRISQLAMRCGAGIIGTRAAVEMGLIEKERQIGQSGNSIAPKIYLGFGVSGASQHIVGIKNADLIIAVNTDKKATIFDYADYQIIEDLEDVIAEMEKQLLLVKRERSIVV